MSLKQPTTVTKLSLTVLDNCFNADKANILYNMLSNSQVKGFTFIKTAEMMDYKDSEYSDFKTNMFPIKRLNNMVTDIRWVNPKC